MTSLTLAGGSVLVGGRFVPADVLVEDGLVATIGPGLAPRGQLVDCRDRFVVPGLVDLQVLGGGARNFTLDIDEASYEAIARAHAATGTTALCPTITTAPLGEMLSAISLAADLCERQIVRGASFVGIHVEGPFLAPSHRGAAHPAAHVQQPAPDVARALLEAGRGWVRVVTLAPELEGALPVIELLAREGVHVSAGHTAADESDMYPAMAHGLSGVTDLLHDMEPLGGRTPGPVGLVLGSSLYAGLIADLTHVRPEAMRGVLRARPFGHTYLVSNAAAPLGTEIDSFDFRGPASVEGGACVSATGELVGTATSLSRMVRNLIRELEITVEAAVAMATTVPAQVIGLRDHGVIRPGATANLLVIERFKVSGVVLRGQLIEAWPNFHHL